MDLIYANRNGEDIGVLDAYFFDLAYGEDENNFQLTLLSKDYNLGPGYIVYIDGTEYGGIIDTITSDVKNETVICSGRTWHGILADKVICPDGKMEHYEVSGNANDILETLMLKLGLNNTFFIRNTESEVFIPLYTFDRYVPAYKGICDMLSSVNAKLKLKHEGRFVYISAEMKENYADNEEWDASQFVFSVTQNYNPINHLICLGQGELKDRAVIHLFTNEYGGIMPYKLFDDEEAKSDDDYILNERNKVLIYTDERTSVFDYPNASITTKYIYFEDPQSDWKKMIENGDIYSKEVNQNGNVNYDLVEIENRTDYLYNPVNQKPADWDNSYNSYFEFKNGEYVPVSAVTHMDYERINRIPLDWATNYADYYKESGLGYEKVSGRTYDDYELLTDKPSDWAARFDNYYVYKNKQYVKLQKTGVNELYAPQFVMNKYYKKVQKVCAPPFENINYYTGTEVTTAPTFTSGFYSRTEYNYQYYPSWVADKYYRRYDDKYQALVEAGCAKLNEYWSQDNIDIKFDTSEDYDIGDIVGATDEVTGISVWREISKKIVTIEDGIVKTNYQIKKG